MNVLMAALTAAIFPGVASAVITRLLMWVVAMLTESGPDFDPVNSLGIAIFYVLVLLPGCLALAFARGRWPWLVFGAGVALLVSQAVSIGLQETASVQDMTAGRWAALVLVLAGMLATYAAQVVASAHLARRARARTPFRRGSRRRIHQATT